MTAAKRCPRCGQVKAAEEFYRRRRSGRRLSPYCQPCSRAASREARTHRKDPGSAGRLRAVDRIRQRRHRALGRQGGEGS